MGGASGRSSARSARRPSACRGRASRAITARPRSKALARYQRLTERAEALIASVHLAGTNTRRVERALLGLLQGAVGKDVVSRAWRKVKVDRVRPQSRRGGHRTADPRRHGARHAIGQKGRERLRAGGHRRAPRRPEDPAFDPEYGQESTSAWRRFLDDLDARGLKRPDFVVVDGASGLEAALTALCGEELPIQRCTVHKHRNLLGHAPNHLHDELTEDDRDMIYAATVAEVENRRQAFLRKWRLKCRAVADSLEEAGDRLFTFTGLPPEQWKSARTTNAIERLNEELRRRIETQTVLPCADTVPMLLWALLASGQITMRKVDGLANPLPARRDDPARPRRLIKGT